MAQFVSHAQNWEDVRLRRLFRDVPSGFYVDVGAAHPIFHSFTYTLYQQGWRGINIEPLPTFFSAFATERARDVNLQAVVGQGGADEVPFYEVVDAPGSSTFDLATADLLRSQGHAVAAHAIPMLTLRTILERHAPGQIDLLKVDVEGAEADVLAGSDWDRFRPRLVVVEVNQPERWEQTLLGHGYIKAAFDGINNWYVERSEAAWVDVLAPPVSVLDDFVPYELALEAGAHVMSVDHAVSEPGRTSARPTLLVALSSSNHLYSGTGRVLFETLRRLTGRFEIEIAIDDAQDRNVALARGFCEEHGLLCHVGPASWLPGAPDAGNGGLAAVMGARRWDVVLAISWANAATNSTVLEHIGDTALAYLPLHQPVWSIPLAPEGRDLVPEIELATLRRADIVFCITPFERHALSEFAEPDALNLAVIPPGCDFTQFRPGLATRPRDLLFVGDHREPRKRFDRVVAVLDCLRRHRPARLLVIGNDSDRAVGAVPGHLADSVVSLGYVDEERLARAYREAAVLLLLSEYEAFGLPVVEALASATPVVMTDQPAPSSLFGSEDGVHFVEPDDTGRVADVVTALLDGDPSPHARLAARQPLLESTFDWDSAAKRTGDHLVAAWARRARASGGFLTLLGAVR